MLKQTSSSSFQKSSPNIIVIIVSIYSIISNISINIKPIPLHKCIQTKPLQTTTSTILLRNNLTYGVPECYWAGAHQCIPPPAQGQGAGCTTRSQPAPRNHTAKPNTVTTYIHQPYLIHSHTSFTPCPFTPNTVITFIHQPYLIHNRNLQGTKLTAHHQRQQPRPQQQKLSNKSRERVAKNKPQAIKLSFARPK